MTMIKDECTCRQCSYYVGKKYHNQIMRILWRIDKYLLTKLNISDIHNLEDEIVKLQQIFDCEKEDENE